MNTTKLLERIRYTGPLHVSHETLRELQRAFLLAAPFENLDIHLGRHIAFTPEAVFQKVVDRKRGGFCYELNSLFHDLLGALGFNVSFLAATMMREGRPGTIMGQMVLGVEIEGRRWLTDVGNGKSCREPLNFDGSNESSAEGVSYRVGQTELGTVVLQTGPNGEWTPRFIVDTEPRNRDEFLQVCEWTQSSPDSTFTQRRICTLALPDGRITLLDGKLTIEDHGKVEEREIAIDEFDRCVSEHFGINLERSGTRA